MGVPILCILNIGHSRKDPGCINRNYNVTEFEFNHQLALDIESALEKTSVSCMLVYQDTYSGLATLINGFDPDFVLSLHANSFDTKVRGCEVLYYWETTLDGGESLVLADMAQKNLNSALHNPNRGVLPRTADNRGGKLLRDVNAPIVLCEPFFLDNDVDYQNAINNYDILVAAYVKTIVQYSER